MYLNLRYIYYVLLLSSIIILSLRWKKLDRSIHIYLVIISSALLTELNADFCHSSENLLLKSQITDSINNILVFLKFNKITGISYFDSVRKAVYHIYCCIELVLLGIYYNSLFEKRGNRQVVSIGIYIYFICFLFVYIFHSNAFLSFNRIDLVYEGIYLSLLSVLYIIELYEKKNPVILKSFPHFWLVFGNLIYFASGIFTNIYTQYLFDNNIKDYDLVYNLGATLNYILYSFYIIAFLCPLETKR